MMSNYRNFLNRNKASFPNYSGEGTTANNMYVGEQPNFNEEYEGYRNLSKGGVNNADLNNALAGYREFAQTGGFSDKDIQDLRARAISPTRAVYANAQANIDRQRRLQGGYSPNYTAATAKLTRDLGQSVSDANVNANASIAEARQRGKLQGLQGESTAAIAVEQLNNQMKLAGLGGMTDVDKARLQAQLSNSSQNLQAMSGMRDAYTATPGLASLAANMFQGSNRDLLSANEQQNQMGLGLINAYLGMSRQPGDFQQGLGNTSSILGLLGGGSNLLGNLGIGGSGIGAGAGGSGQDTGDGGIPLGDFGEEAGGAPTGQGVKVGGPRAFPIGNNYPTIDVGGQYPFQRDWGMGSNQPNLNAQNPNPYDNDWSWRFSGQKPIFGSY